MSASTDGTSAPSAADLLWIERQEMKKVIAQLRKDIGHMLEGGAAGCATCRDIENRHKRELEPK